MRKHSYSSPWSHPFASATSRTVQAWKAVLYMKRFPHLWNWRRKPSVAGMDPWQPTEVVFNDSNIPNHMRFQEARWLCPPVHMSARVRAEFATRAGDIEPPENVCHRLDPCALPCTPCAPHHTPPSCSWCMLISSQGLLDVAAAGNGMFRGCCRSAG